MQIEINGTVYPVEITYKRIRNMYLRVTPDGILHVSCSRTTSKKKIELFIQSKAQWIERTLGKVQKRAGHIQTGTQGTATWMGKEYPVELIISARASMRVTEDRIIMHVRENSAEEIERVFYAYAGRKIAELADAYRGRWDDRICLRNRLPLPKITIRYMTGRWGSCTPANASIRLSSRLIHYPLECFEYVLLHEYAHLLVANHSAAFYAVVAEHMPDYKRVQALLKQ